MENDRRLQEGEALLVMRDEAVEIAGNLWIQEWSWHGLDSRFGPLSSFDVRTCVVISRGAAEKLLAVARGAAEHADRTQQKTPGRDSLRASA